MGIIKLSIIIPCYNEEENIPYLVKSINDLDRADTEIILVDNGSTDDTSRVLLKELESNNNNLIHSVRVEKNIGYGNGIMAGIKMSKGDIIAWTHADLQTDIKDVYKGYDIFRMHTNQGKIFLKGSRRKRAFIDLILTCGMSIISSIMLRKKFNDINAQPKMFHRSFLDLANNAPDDFSLDLYFYYVALKNRMDVLKLPVYFKDRLYGVAKGGGGSSIWTRINIIKRTLKYIYQLKKNI